MKNERRIEAGSRMFFGVPAEPMPKIRAEAIGRAVAQVPGVVEAYLPQCYIEGDDAPRQILVIGVQSKERIPATMQDLVDQMKSVMAPDEFIDMLPFACADLPPAARVMECRVCGGEVETKKPWWKLW